MFSEKSNEVTSDVVQFTSVSDQGRIRGCQVYHGSQGNEEVDLVLPVVIVGCQGVEHLRSAL